MSTDFGPQHEQREEGGAGGGGGRGGGGYLPSLSEDFTGVNDEGQRLHLQSFIDGRHFVLQVDGEVLQNNNSSFKQLQLIRAGTWR